MDENQVVIALKNETTLPDHLFEDFAPDWRRHILRAHVGSETLGKFDKGFFRSGYHSPVSKILHQVP